MFNRNPVWLSFAVSLNDMRISIREIYAINFQKSEESKLYLIAVILYIDRYIFNAKIRYHLYWGISLMQMYTSHKLIGHYSETLTKFFFNNTICPDICHLISFYYSSS